MKIVNEKYEIDNNGFVSLYCLLKEDLKKIKIEDTECLELLEEWGNEKLYRYKGKYVLKSKGGYYEICL